MQTFKLKDLLATEFDFAFTYIQTQNVGTLVLEVLGNPKC